MKIGLTTNALWTPFRIKKKDAPGATDPTEWVISDDFGTTRQIIMLSDVNYWLGSEFLIVNAAISVTNLYDLL